MPTKKRKKKEGKSSDVGSSIRGQYANYFKVGYNAFEFIIDFGQFYSGNDNAELYTRLVLTPVHAKSLFETLGTSIESYEKRFGDIDEIVKKCKGGTD